MLRDVMPSNTAMPGIGVNAARPGATLGLIGPGDMGMEMSQGNVPYGYMGSAVPSTVVHISSDNVPITYQFLCPPEDTPSNALLMPEQPVYAIREKDPDLETNSTPVRSLAQINKDARDQWNDFVLFTTDNSRTNPHFKEEAREFLDWCIEYGEAALFTYGNAVAQGNAKRLQDLSIYRPYWERSTTEGYCYLTAYGFRRRLNFLGIIVSVPHAVGIDDAFMDYEGHFALSVSLARQTRTANCFGRSDEITTGSSLWVVLTRRHCGKRRFGAFMLKPCGSKMRDTPLMRQMHYFDESGAMRPGYYQRVGVVLEPGDRSPAPSAIESATNTGPQTSNQLAHSYNATLPTLLVAVRFAH